MMMLFSNFLLTIISMKMGFAYYGLGYFLSSLMTFAISAFIAVQYLRDVPYHAFVTNNTSVEK